MKSTPAPAGSCLNIATAWRDVSILNIASCGNLRWKVPPPPPKKNLTPPKAHESSVQCNHYHLLLSLQGGNALDGGPVHIAVVVGGLAADGGVDHH